MRRDYGMHTMENDVTEIIREIGIPAHIKGYQYIREGIMMAVNDMNMLNYFQSVYVGNEHIHQQHIRLCLQHLIIHLISIRCTANDIESLPIIGF